ncbi:MAG: hypothetical protein V4714_05910 [Bacteroidota bacterium]
MPQVNVQATVWARVGEFMQGQSSAGDFLVSGCSSQHFYSTATLSNSIEPQLDLPPKAAQAFTLFLQKHASLAFRQEAVFPLAACQAAELQGLSLSVQSNIPPGKGLSSSSADVLSVLVVLNTYFQQPFDESKLYQLAALIEPTDPCLSINTVLFDQSQGRIMQSIPMPPLGVIYFDSMPAVQVDTIRLSLVRNYSNTDQIIFGSLLTDFIQAAEKGNYPALFNSMSASAMRNQSYLPLPGFAHWLAFAQKHQAGVFIAHSGTILGLAVEKNRLETMQPLAADFIRQHWKQGVIYVEACG